VGESAERPVARLAPPFDCGLVEPCPSEMMRDDLWLAFGDRREAVTQRLADASMQNLSPALEKTLIGRVLDQGMLEAVDCLGGTPRRVANSASSSLASATFNAASSSAATERSQRDELLYLFRVGVISLPHSTLDR
jgi:hypothetical protein